MQVEEKQRTASRSYIGQNLRGQNFKGQDLAGADFSRADIRGTRFVDADLQGAKFVDAKAGVQKQWFVAQFVSAFAFALLLNLVAAYFDVAIFEYFFGASTIKEITAIPGIYVLFTQFFCLSVVWQQGFSLRALSFVLAAILSAIGITFAFAGFFSVAITFAVSGAVAFAFLFAGVVLVAGAGAFAGIVAGGFLFWGAIILAGAFAGGLEFAAGVVAAVGVSGYSLLLVRDIAHLAQSGDERFILTQTVGLSFSSLGGTSFSGANLTNGHLEK